METRFDNSRKFGVEIEFVGNANNVCEAVNQSGVNCYIESYNHVTRAWWKIVTDASCGYELVSPPLNGEDGMNQLKKVCDALKVADAKVNIHTGLHVHHDAGDFDVNTFKRLYALYIRYESTIDSMMPLSRRGSRNEYCRAIDYYFYSKQACMDRIKSCKTIQELQAMFCSRYMKLNICSFVKHGTIEFRQHSGTLDFNKISNWIILTQLMINKAKTSSVKMVYNQELDTFDGFKKMMNMTKAKGADDKVISIVKFYKNRIKELEVA